jgi:transmembrane sensor
MSIKSDPSTFGESVRRAIEWEVLLHSGDATEGDARRFQDWLAQADINARAWADLQKRLSPVKSLDAVRAAAASEALRTAVAPRRAFLKAGTALGLAAVGAFGVRDLIHRFGLDADYKTGTAGSQDVALAPGVQMTMGAATRVYVSANVVGPSVQIENGQVVIRRKASSLASLSSLSSLPSRRPHPVPVSDPLVVTTQHGTITTRGTAISVDVFRGHGVVANHGGSAVIRVDGRGSQTVADGGVWSFGEEGFRRLPESVDDIFAWTDGSIVVENRPVSDLLDDLRRYRAGLVYFPSDSADRRISGVFPVNDVDGSLQQLADTLHLQLSFYGSYLVVAS